MKKLFLILTLSLSFLGAADLHEKIRSFMGTAKYEAQKNLINVLFAQNAQFLNPNGDVNSIKVISVLKKNGLMQLLYDKPVNLRLAFRTKQDPFIFLKIINESLELMGYNYFLTNNALRDSGGFVWEIYLQTEHILDPEVFSNILEARGCTITNIVKNENHYWFYDINSDNAYLSAKKIESGITTPLGKPLNPYWIDIKHAQEITLSANAADRWFPNVLFFDENLNLLSHVKADESTRTLKLKVPQGAVYLKISDTVMLDNIKHGLSLHVKE
ncbi:hypothetical protein [Sulfurospirillum barnesii]|uniref:Periplasmic protein n=1 Tax=Sulfurospirillum barnesii (strain ATCC 700032 / DSM 10660 / SES-3) TaxID=760154 RepID=I3XU88_SULBS|nr:hypothetical protein [Sulfurospirillum barnesii]AFL67512.1 hypothetical protein Sulba_0185 [Sulfurospirillum barnesii SES-3]